MAAPYHNRIEQSPLPINPVYREFIADSETRPGSLVAVNASGDAAFPAAAALVPARFALENVADAVGIDDNYPAGAIMRTRVFESGQEVYALLADGNSVTPASNLVAAANGELALATTETGRALICRSTETINNTSGAAVRIVVEIL